MRHSSSSDRRDTSGASFELRSAATWQRPEQNYSVTFDEPFAALAADEPDDSHVAAVCMWLARTIRDGATQGVQLYIELINTMPKRDDSEWFTFGAVPALLRRPEAEPLPEEIRRDGWLQILDRRDTLAAKVAQLVQMWDGGEDWQAGVTAQVRPKECSTAAEWAARLVPAPTDQPPTALERDLPLWDDPGDADGGLLQDPETGMPALYFHKDTSDEYIATKVPFRIPTTAPLASVILSNSLVWIVTRDEKLWMAPEYTGNGLSWGYEGGGPYTLAQLIERLLDDIISPAVDAHASRPRPGLLRLFSNPDIGDSATYTRERIEKARDEPPEPGDGWLEEDD